MYVCVCNYGVLRAVTSLHFPGKCVYIYLCITHMNVCACICVVMCLLSFYVCICYIVINYVLVCLYICIVEPCADRTATGDNL